MLCARASCSRRRTERGSGMPPRSLYFVNGWVDWLALGGLSILTAIALVGLGGATDGAALRPFLLPLAMVLNYPHFSATIYRLYQNPHHLREFPVTALGLPVLLFLAVIAGLSQPELIGSYLIMLYLLWSPYHYSGQTVDHYSGQTVDHYSGQTVGLT